MIFLGTSRLNQSVSGGNKFYSPNHMCQNWSVFFRTDTSCLKIDSSNFLSQILSTVVVLLSLQLIPHTFQLKQ